MAKEPNPAYMHIASAIREAMARLNIKAADVHEALGKSRSSTTIYPWINGTSAPTEEYVIKLAKVLQLKVEDLTPKDNVTALEPKALMILPSKTAAAKDVLVFNVSEDGTARIRLDATLTLEAASPLLRLLLDAGIVMSKG